MFNLRTWLGDYLGIIPLAQAQIRLADNQRSLCEMLNNIEAKLDKSIHQINTTNAALASVIAKLDPMAVLTHYRYKP